MKGTMFARDTAKGDGTFLSPWSCPSVEHGSSLPILTRTQMNKAGINERLALVAERRDEANAAWEAWRKKQRGKDAKKSMQKMQEIELRKDEKNKILHETQAAARADRIEAQKVAAHAARRLKQNQMDARVRTSKKQKVMKRQLAQLEELAMSPLLSPPTPVSPAKAKKKHTRKSKPEPNQNLQLTPVALATEYKRKRESLICPLVLTTNSVTRPRSSAAAARPVSSKIYTVTARKEDEHKVAVLESASIITDRNNLLSKVDPPLGTCATQSNEKKHEEIQQTVTEYIDKCDNTQENSSIQSVDKNRASNQLQLIVTGRTASTETEFIDNEAFVTKENPSMKHESTKQDISVSESTSGSDKIPLEEKESTSKLFEYEPCNKNASTKDELPSTFSETKLSTDTKCAKEEEPTELKESACIEELCSTEQQISEMTKDTSCVKSAPTKEVAEAASSCAFPVHKKTQSTADPEDSLCVERTPVNKEEHSSVDIEMTTSIEDNSAKQMPTSSNIEHYPCDDNLLAKLEPTVTTEATCAEKTPALEQDTSAPTECTPCIEETSTIEEPTLKSTGETADTERYSRPDESTLITPDTVGIQSTLTKDESAVSKETTCIVESSEKARCDTVPSEDNTCVENIIEKEDAAAVYSEDPSCMQETHATDKLVEVDKTAHIENGPKTETSIVVISEDVQCLEDEATIGEALMTQKPSCAEFLSAEEAVVAGESPYTENFSAKKSAVAGDFSCIQNIAATVEPIVTEEISRNEDSVATKEFSPAAISAAPEMLSIAKVEEDDRTSSSSAVENNEKDTSEATKPSCFEKAAPEEQEKVEAEDEEEEGLWTDDEEDFTLHPRR